MKHFTALILIFMILLPIAGCGSAGDIQNIPHTSPVVFEDTDAVRPTDETDKNDSKATNAPGREAVNIYFHTMEDYKIIKRYQELHPDLPYKITFYNFAAIDYNYYAVIDKRLTEGGKDMPDIYFVESTYVEKYARGDMSHYAAPYRDLGIDVDTLLKEADIYQHVIDMGSKRRRPGSCLRLPGNRRSFHLSPLHRKVGLGNG